MVGVRLVNEYQVLSPDQERLLEALLRQVALAQQVLRSEDNEAIVNSVRSEGLVTEVDVRGSGLTSRLDLCDNYSENYCVLTEPDGTIHPLIGHTDDAVEGLRQSLDSLRADLASVTQQAAQAKREMRAEIAKLEPAAAKLVDEVEFND